MANNFLNLPAKEIENIDTPGWENGYSKNCTVYALDLCVNGGARPGSEWTLGATYRFPEKNCVVCGKEKIVDTSKPDLYLMISPPLYKEDQFGIDQTVVNELIPELIPMIAQNLSITNNIIVNVIDIFNTLGGASLTEPQMFADFCHPNDQGY